MEKSTPKMTDCIFCKIVNQEIPAKILYENDSFIAINDLNPVAPIHILLISKKHYENILESAPSEGADLINAVKSLQESTKTESKNGHRLVMNSGDNGGQTVMHFHAHFLAGRKISWPPG